MSVWAMAIIAGCTHGVFVFFKAFQQRNVAFMHYAWVLPISYCMSTTEVIVMSFIAVQAVAAERWADMIPLIICLGTGSGIGAIIAMWAHHRYVGVKRGKANEDTIRVQQGQRRSERRDEHFV